MLASSRINIQEEGGRDAAEWVGEGHTGTLAVASGLGILDDRWTATTEFGFGLSDRDRELRLGWRLTESVSTGLAFELGLEGTRRESSDGIGGEHGVGIGAGWRLAGPSRRGLAFDVRIEAARRDAANDDNPPGPHHRA